jgi:hypothetical protein
MSSGRCYCSVSLDNGPPIDILLTSRTGSLYSAAGLFNTQHTLVVSYLYSSDQHQLLRLSVDSAYVDLSQETQLAPGVDMLTINYTDPSLVYSGRWKRKLNIQGLSFMESMDVGSLVSFAFFGKSITVWGYWPLVSGAIDLSMSIDDATPTLRSYENKYLEDFYIVYESDDIGGTTELEG